jgi:tight adherence protein C
MKSEIYLLGAFVFCSAASFVGALVAASLPSHPASRLGRRGKRRVEAIAKYPSWAKVEPLVRWLGVQVGRFLPSSMKQSLDHEILYAGDYLGIVAQECAALCLLSGLLGGCLGALLEAFAHTHGLVIIAFTTFGLIAPYLELGNAKAQRFMGVARSLPYAVDLFSLGMSAGLDFPAAVRQFVSKAMPDDPLAEEMEYTLQMLSLGNTRRAALLDFAHRVPIDVVREFVQTVIHAEEKGHPLADALVIQAGVSRMRRSVRAEEEAAKAGVKLIIPLTFVFGAMLLLILAPIFIKVIDQVQHGRLEGTAAKAAEWRTG